MKHLPSLAALAIVTQAMADDGFIGGSTATLQTRSYYFSRDYSDLVGGKQSKAEEWAQGFILDFRSGYTPGLVGFGVDAVGVLGLRLDSSPDRTNTGLLPVGDDGRAPGSYSRIDPALKVRLSKTELKIGQFLPDLPILARSDIRLLPPSFRGVGLTSNEIDGLTLQAGRLNQTSLRNEAGGEKLVAMLGHTPYRSVESDAFDYLGGEYAFNQNRTRASLWFGTLEDIYRQSFVGLKHRQPVGDWVLGADVGVYSAREDGQARLGNIDNRTFTGLFSAKRGGHTVYLGYQALHGESGMPRVFGQITPLANEVPTYEFADPGERSWQVRYDYDFAAQGVPGLIAGVRYLKGDNVDTPGGYEGRDRERDLDIAYVVQSGPLAGLGIKYRNAMARSNYRTDIDENRLYLLYSWKLF